MIEDLKPYPETRDSGLAWLGEIPAHWQIKRNGSLFQQRNAVGEPDWPILEVSLRTGVRIREFGSSKRKQVMSDKAKYKCAAKGDYVYNMMRMWQGAAGIAPVDGLVSPAYVVAKPLPQVNPTYFASLFRTDDYLAVIDAFSRGIVKDRNRLYWDQFKQIPTPCPSPEEQAAIARFLAWATNRLDRAIRAKRKIIALLNEQKQAIIHRAVTRGLDPSVPLKDSGVPWLGEIPEHWEVITAGAVSDLIQTGPFGSQLHQSDYISGGMPVINPSHMIDGRITHDPRICIAADKASSLSRHKIKPGDVLIARRGDLGRCAIASSSEDGWLCGTGSVLIRCKTRLISSEFFQIVFSSSGMARELQLSSIGSTMANLNEGAVARQRIPLPTIAEQSTIADWIADKTRVVRGSVSRIAKEIDLLHEYRTRLIADVVTGKLDVREVAAGLPEPTQSVDELPDSDYEESDNDDEIEVTESTD